MNNEEFLKSYTHNKYATWIRCKLTNGEEFNYDKFEGWRKIKDKCDKENLFLSELYLQFRSHKATIDIDNGVDGVYLIRSLLGAIGSDSKEYYTVGLVKGNSVSKKMWITPELVLDKEYEDEIENCFEEAIIYDKTKEN